MRLKPKEAGMGGRVGSGTLHSSVPMTLLLMMLMMLGTVSPTTIATSEATSSTTNFSMIDNNSTDHDSDFVPDLPTLGPPRDAIYHTFKSESGKLQVTQLSTTSLKVTWPHDYYNDDDGPTSATSSGNKTGYFHKLVVENLNNGTKVEEDIYVQGVDSKEKEAHIVRGIDSDSTFEVCVYWTNSNYEIEGNDDVECLNITLSTITHLPEEEEVEELEIKDQYSTSLTLAWPIVADAADANVGMNISSARIVHYHQITWQEQSSNTAMRKNKATQNTGHPTVVYTIGDLEPGTVYEVCVYWTDSSYTVNDNTPMQCLNDSTLLPAVTGIKMDLDEESGLVNVTWDPLDWHNKDAE